MHDSLSSCFLRGTQKMTFKLNQVKEKESSQSLLGTEPVNINYIKSVTDENFDKTKCHGKDTWRDRCNTRIHFKSHTTLFGNLAFISSTSVFFTPFQNIEDPQQQPATKREGWSFCRKTLMADNGSPQERGRRSSMILSKIGVRIKAL